MSKTYNQLKGEAFNLLQQMRKEIEEKRKELIHDDGLTELEAEAKLLYSKSIQKKARDRVLKTIELNEYFIKN